MQEEQKAVKHKLTLDMRRRCLLTGVTDVVSFDEACVMAETDAGAIVLRGAGLHVERLNLESGEVDVDGRFDSLAYEERGKLKQSFMSRVFR